MAHYFVVPAPGYYGDQAVVISSHSNIEAARRAAAKLGRIARKGDKRKGDKWVRANEAIYPPA